MKKLKFLFIIVLVTVFFFSCITSKFTPAEVALGSDIDSVVGKYGKPFKTDVYMEDKVRCETLYYKEMVFSAGCNYVLTTILSFKDSVLVNFKQVDKMLYDNDVTVDTPSE